MVSPASQEIQSYIGQTDFRFLALVIVQALPKLEARAPADSSSTSFPALDLTLGPMAASVTSLNRAALLRSRG